MNDRNEIREGMTVYSSDGEKLGKVRRCEASTFVIEKGFFFPKDYVARYDQIAGVDGDDIRLLLTKASFAGMREGEGYATGAAGESSREATRSAGEDIRVPVAEEELDVVKRDREAGEVRLAKDVVTETKHVDVPVTREEVRVEHVPAERSAAPGEDDFERTSTSMPVREEELEVHKRPVVKEEVRLHKERITEQRAAEADLRKERVDVEGGREVGVREPGKDEEK